MKGFDALFEAARTAQRSAHCPYSGFAVGAAVRAPGGAVYAGCNVENSSYPEGCCAETSAIAAMVLAGERRIEAIAVVGSGEELCTPCGGCRQRILEFAAAGTAVYVCGPEGLRREFGIEELLPHAFGAHNLDIGDSRQKS